MNVAIVRLHVVDDSTVGSVIAAAQEQIQQAARYLKTPYPWLREQYAARAGASPAPFRFVFNFAAIDGVIITLPGLTTSRIDVFSDTPAVADMSVHVYGRGEGWCGLVVYKAEMYSATYIESIAHAYTHLLSAPLDEKVANVTVPS